MNATMTQAEKRTGQIDQQTNSQWLIVHGHFYQPPREDPFSDLLPVEPGAAPFANYNEKITAECYHPNAKLGNFELISYDMGPTLASWLEKHHPDVYQRIILDNARHRQRYGTGNALSQVYNHTILPLASTRDKRTQILWGMADFRHRYGHAASGMWLAETAVDLECLNMLASLGITHTILAPWQSEMPIDPSEPYIVRLSEGRSIVVFFYNNRSGSVSFDQQLTMNADTFSDELASHWNQEKIGADIPQLMILATDGEFYGHHQEDRDKFLSYLINTAAPNRGYEVGTLERYLQLYPPTKEARIREKSAWSCAHGSARWSIGCDCTEGDSRWKPALLLAITKLNERGAQIFEQYTREVLVSPWAARDEYLGLRNGWEPAISFWERNGKQHRIPDAELAWRTRMLLEAQYYHQYSFTSCGWFFEDLDRIEPRNTIAFARRAISLAFQATGIDLQSSFVTDLSLARSWKTGRTGADVYASLPAVLANLLPGEALQ
jgi:Domain of unknown function (DUF3536)/Glycosyl hydrolase family 57